MLLYSDRISMVYALFTTPRWVIIEIYTIYSDTHEYASVTSYENTSVEQIYTMYEFSESLMQCDSS